MKEGEKEVCNSCQFVKIDEVEVLTLQLLELYNHFFQNTNFQYYHRRTEIPTGRKEGYGGGDLNGSSISIFFLSMFCFCLQKLHFVNIFISQRKISHCAQTTHKFSLKHNSLFSLFSKEFRWFGFPIGFRFPLRYHRTDY